MPRALGFEVEGAILNAADFGVPQRRRRAFVIGSRVGPPQWPAAHFFPPPDVPSGGYPWRTVRQALEGLPLGPDGQNWHNARSPRAMSVERYKAIPNEGEGRFDLAARRPDITPACWLRKESGSTDVFGRLWWDRPAFTIRTEFYKPEKGRYLHPSEHRPLTVREAARLMTFPDEFTFPLDQPMNAVARQVGNSVPPRLAETLARSLASQLDAASAQPTAVAA